MTVGEAIKQVSESTSTLLSRHLELFRAELRADAVKLGRDAGTGLSGLPFLMVGFALLNAALAFAVGSELGLGWGFFVVGLLDCAIGAMVSLAALRRLRADQPTFPATSDELRRDRAWLSSLRQSI